MKRHGVVPEAAMEAGRFNGSLSKPPGSVSMMPPNIQPYQAKGHGSSSAKGGQQRDGWQKNAAMLGVMWAGGCFLGYTALWPINLALRILGTFLPLGSLESIGGWWNHGLPAPDVFPVASELRLPSNQVSHLLESYLQTYGEAALIFAAHDGYAQLVTALLSDRAFGYQDLLDAADESGHTALLYAVGRGFPQVTSALLRAGADPDAPKQGQGGNGLTPLMEAAGTGHAEILNILLQANATVDARDANGNTALMYAAHGGHLGALRSLLDQGALRDLVNTRGDNALSMATSRGNQAAVDALQRGARPVVESRRTSASSGSSGSSSGSSNKEAKNKEIEEKLAKAMKAATDQHPDRGKATVSSKQEEADDTESPSSMESALSRFLGGGSSDKSKKDDASSGEAALAEKKKVKKLEAEIDSLKRTHESAELKSQRRIVELLEASTDKQKLLDDLERERKEISQRADDLAAKLRQKEGQELESEERQARLSKEAHEARMDAERERSKAESAQRERERQQQEVQRLERALQLRDKEGEEQKERVERLQGQLQSLRLEVQHAEDERRALQRQVDVYRSSSATAPPAATAAPPAVPLGRDAAAPPAQAAAERPSQAAPVSGEAAALGEAPARAAPGGDAAAEAAGMAAASSPPPVVT